MHEPTTLLPAPSHGSSVNSCRWLSTSLNLLQFLHDCWERLKWSCVFDVRYENGQAKVWATLCHEILFKAWRIRYCDLWKITKRLWRTFPIQGTSVQMAQVHLEAENKWKTNLVREDVQPHKRKTMWKEWWPLLGQNVDWRWEWSVVS